LEEACYHNNSIATKMNQQTLHELIDWYMNRKCAPPSPSCVKHTVLLRHAMPNSTWIETGTYLGETTAFLAHIAPHVHTIEPSIELLEMARENCRHFSNISFHHGTSEATLSTVIASVAGNCSFWLDGHYSAGNTYKGNLNTPIRHELKTIGKHIHRLKRLAIFIDDTRCSYTDQSTYPDLDLYVAFARANGLEWIIEQDIFVAKSNEVPMYQI